MTETAFSMLKNIAKQIYHKIHQAKKIILVSHKNPDGDALGSLTALAQLFKKLKKKFHCYSATEISPAYNYLPHLNLISNSLGMWQDMEVDLVIILDCGDTNHAGIEKHIKQNKRKPFIINIDHHNTNLMFGNTNFVNPLSSSTSEIIYHFFKYNNLEIDKLTATCLLTGLIFDTDHFNNPATSSNSLQIAGEMVNHGADIILIKNYLLKNKTINLLKLWGIAFTRLSKEEGLEVVHTFITQKDLEENNLKDSEIEGISNFLNNMNEGVAALMLRELPDGRVKGSFRTTNEKMDVSKIAQIFGGGGHKKAAGFTMEGPLEKAKEKIFTVMKDNAQL